MSQKALFASLAKRRPPPGTAIGSIQGFKTVTPTKSSADSESSEEKDSVSPPKPILDDNLEKSQNDFKQPLQVGPNRNTKPKPKSQPVISAASKRPSRRARERHKISSCRKSSTEDDRPPQTTEPTEKVSEESPPPKIAPGLVCARRSRPPVSTSSKNPKASVQKTSIEDDTPTKEIAAAVPKLNLKSTPVSPTSSKTKSVGKNAENGIDSEPKPAQGKRTSRRNNRAKSKETQAAKTDTKKGFKTPRNYGETEDKWKSRSVFAKLAKQRSGASSTGSNPTPNGDISAPVTTPRETDTNVDGASTATSLLAGSVANGNKLSPKRRAAVAEKRGSPKVQRSENSESGNDLAGLGMMESEQIEDDGMAAMDTEDSSQTKKRSRVLGSSRKPAARKLNYQSYSIQQFEDSPAKNTTPHNQSTSEPLAYDFDDEFEDAPAQTASQPVRHNGFVAPLPPPPLSNSQPSHSISSSRFAAPNPVVTYGFGQRQVLRKEKHLYTVIDKTQKARSLQKKGNQKIFIEDIEYIFENTMPDKNEADKEAAIQEALENLPLSIRSFSERIDSDEEFQNFLIEHYCVLENMVSQFLGGQVMQRGIETGRVDIYESCALLLAVLARRRVTFAADRNRKIFALLVKVWSSLGDSSDENGVLERVVEHRKVLGSRNLKEHTVGQLMMTAVHRILMATKDLISQASEAMNDDRGSEDQDWVTEHSGLQKVFTPFMPNLSDTLWRHLKNSISAGTSAISSQIFDIIAFFNRFDTFEPFKSDLAETIVQRLVTTALPPSLETTFLRTMSSCLSDNELAATKFGKVDAVWPYLLGFLVRDCEYNLQVTVFSLTASLLDQSATNRLVFEKNTPAVKKIINVYKKHEKIIAKYESNLGEDNGLDPDETFQIELNADEAKMEESEQGQMKRVLNKAELHMRSTVLAANVAMLLGCCIRHSRYGKIANLVKEARLSYKQMSTIVRKFLDFLQLMHGITDKGKRVMEDIITVYSKYEESC